jgi:hypothetical protein
VTLGGKVKVTDRDRGFRQLTQKIGAAKPSALTIGVHDSEGGASTPSGKTVAEIAAFHEYGEGPPERSFIRAWVDASEEQIASDLKKMGEAIARGKLTPTMALERLGLLYVGQVQQRIAAGIAPPLAQSTIDRKGSSTPLVHTGQLRSSIRHKVSEE